MSDPRKLTAIVGQPVQIVLQSQVGSTGYGWYLTDLDGGLVLSDSCVHPVSSMPGGACNHAFSFLALKAGSFKVVFQMIAPWRPSAPAQTETYEVEISNPEKTPEADIEAAMKSSEFVGPEAVAGAVSGPTVLKYAAPMASHVLKYAAPMATTTDPLRTSVSHLPCPPYHYTHPDPRVATPQVTILYAAPITGGHSPQPMYAAPLPSPHTVYPMYAAPPTMMPPYAAPYTYHPYRC